MYSLILSLLALAIMNFMLAGRFGFGKNTSIKIKLRALTLIGRVPNCQLGRFQFKSGRARKIWFCDFLYKLALIVSY